jgi:RNA polymerase sigma-70 factor, ECF subfamily
LKKQLRFHAIGVCWRAESRCHFGRPWSGRLPHEPFRDSLKELPARVGSPPQERALPLPVIWGRTRRRVVSGPEVTTSGGADDEELMGRLQANDATALDILFDRYSRLVLGISLRVLRDYGEAEDVVQEVFFHVFQRAALFDPSKGSAKGWIIQVAFHRALDKRAHLGRRGFYLGTEIESLDDTLLGETDLDREIGAKLNRAQLEKAFEELPEMQRHTLELFYFEGLELREISEKLNEPLANVRHHYYRGLAKLRKSAFVKKLRER